MADGAPTLAEVRERGVDRRAIERRLDEFVLANRFTISVVVPLMGAVTLISGAMGFLPEWLAFNPYFVLSGTLIMRLPLVAGVAPLIGRKAAALLAGMCLYAYGIEMIGIRTDWPYGAFEYTIDLGPMIEGVPLGLPLFFLPLVLNAYLLAVLLLGPLAARRAVRLPTTLGVVLAIDLVLDPGAVAIGFWNYLGGGVYYGVPLSNYAGWVLSGTIATVAFDIAFDRTDLIARLDERAFMLDDLVSFVVLWGLVNLAFGNWIPVLLTLGLAGGLIATDRFDFDVLADPG
ncbi:MAG: bisanhydrobacterioruberin hydratase [Halobacteriales archaeon]